MRVMPIVVLVFIIMLQILFTCLFIVSTIVFKEELYVIGVPIHLIFVVLLNVISLFLLGKIYRREMAQKIKFTESTYEKQFQSLVASVRSDRHDLNNHLTVIFGLLNIKNYDATANYIKDLIGDIQINNQVLNISNAILASMLFSKMEKFKKENIIFKLHILTEEIVDTLSSTDLIRLLSNLLDNAYDATMELPKEERTIALEFLEIQGKLAIIVKNSSQLKEFDSSFFEIGYSTKSKESNKSRGYGLAIIQEITKKYRAVLNIKVEEQLVCFEFLFPKVSVNDKS